MVEAADRTFKNKKDKAVNSIYGTDYYGPVAKLQQHLSRTVEMYYHSHVK